MPGLRYIVWQEEHGQSGTHHYQGYLELIKKRKRGGVCQLIPRAHFEPRKGTRQQAINYCKKPDTRIRDPWEWGESRGQGSRSDLSRAYEMIRSGASERQLMEEDFGMWARNYRAYIRARRLLLPPRDFKTKVIVLFGETGSGKSRWCHDTFPNAYWKPRGIWWEAYEQQTEVVIDDFYGWLPFDFMLRLLDRYPLLVETKGGSEVFNSRIIIITSNIPPDRWYDYQKNPNLIFAALDRRLDIIVEYKGIWGVSDTASPSNVRVTELRGNLDDVTTLGNASNASIDQSNEIIDFSQ
jgi:Putative viral replication protein/RNA helicase